MPKFAEVNYYKLLDVKPDATIQEIKKAYFKLSRGKHPDKINRAIANDAVINDDQALLNQAKEILLDEKLRAEYDEFLASQPFLSQGKNLSISAVVDGRQVNLSSLIMNAQLSENGLLDYAKGNLDFAFQLIDNPSLLVRFSKVNFVKLILMVYANVLSDEGKKLLLLNSKAVMAMMQSLNDYSPYFIQLSNEKANIIKFIKQQQPFFQKLESNNLAELCRAMPELRTILLTQGNIQRLSVSERNYISKEPSKFSRNFAAQCASIPLSPKNHCQDLIQEIFFSNPIFTAVIIKNFTFIKALSQTTQHGKSHTLKKLLKELSSEANIIEDILIAFDNHPIGIAWFFQFCKKEVTELDKHYNENQFNYLRCFAKTFLKQTVPNLQEEDLVDDITLAQWLKLYPTEEATELLIEWIINNKLELSGFSHEWQSFIIKYILNIENEPNFFYEGFINSPGYKEFFIQNNLWQYFKAYPKALTKYLALPREHLTETVNIVGLPNIKQWPEEIRNILTAKQKLDNSLRYIHDLICFDEYEKYIKLTGFYPELLKMNKMEAKVALDLARRALSCPNSKNKFGREITKLLNQAYYGERNNFETQFIEIFKENCEKPENIILLKEFIFPSDYLKLPNWQIVNTLLSWDAVKTLALIPADNLSKLIEMLNENIFMFEDKQGVNCFLQHPEVIRRRKAYQELWNIFCKKTSDFLQYPSFDIVERIAALDYPEEIIEVLNKNFYESQLEEKIIGIVGLIQMKNTKLFQENSHLRNIMTAAKQEKICLESCDIKLAENFIINNVKDIDYEKLEMLYQKFKEALHPLYEQYNLLPKLAAGRQLRELLSNTKIQKFESIEINYKDIFKECLTQLEQLIKQYGAKIENIPEIAKIVNKMHEIPVGERDPQVNLFINKYALVRNNNLLQWLLQLANANNSWAQIKLSEIVATGSYSDDFLKQDDLLITKFLENKLNKINEKKCFKNIMYLLNNDIIQFSDIANLTDAQLNFLYYEEAFLWLLTKLCEREDRVKPIKIDQVIPNDLPLINVDTSEKRAEIFLNLLTQFGFIRKEMLAEFKQYFPSCYTDLKLQFLQKESYNQEFAQTLKQFLTTTEYQEILAVSKELGGNLLEEKQKLLNHAVKIAFNRINNKLKFSITLSEGNERIERLNKYLQDRTFTLKELCLMSDAQWNVLIYQPQMDIFCEYIGKQDLNTIIPETIEFNAINTKEKMQDFFLGKLEEAKLFDNEAFNKLKNQFPECYRLLKDLLLKTDAPMIMAKQINHFLSHHFYFQLCLVKSQLQKDQDDKSIKYIDQTLKTAIKEVFSVPSSLQTNLLKTEDETPKIVVDIDQKIQDLLKEPVKFEVKKINFFMRLARAVVGGLFAISSGFLLCFNTQSFNYFFRPDRFVDTRAYHRVKYLYTARVQNINQPNKEWVRDYLLDYQTSKMTKSLVHTAPTIKSQAIAKIANDVMKQEDVGTENMKIGSKIDSWLKENMADAKLLSKHRCFITSGRKFTKTQEVINELCNSNVKLGSNKSVFRRQ